MLESSAQPLFFFFWNVVASFFAFKIPLASTVDPQSNGLTCCGIEICLFWKIDLKLIKIKMKLIDID